MDTVIVPRPDGLITRDQAADLCGVTPQAITNWASSGYGPRNARRRLPVAKRENGRPLFDPVEVAKAEHATAPRARRMLSVALDAKEPAPRSSRTRGGLFLTFPSSWKGVQSPPRSSPVASATFRAAESRRRSRRVSPAGSCKVMVPDGPVTLMRPLPTRSTVPPASFTALASSRAAGLRHRSGISRQFLDHRVALTHPR